MQVSKHFTLAQLTVTEQKTANKPPPSVMSELAILGSVLDEIYEKIGPFNVVSAYRSQETQDALKSGGNVQAVSKSYHTLGMAADISPTKEGISSFFFKILAHPTISKKVGGVAIKSNTIHFDTDIKKRVGVGLKVTSSGAYVRLPASEVSAGIKKYTTVQKGVGVGVLIAGALAAYFLFVKKKDNVRSNPVPPASVAKAAKLGLKMRAEQSPSRRGGTSVGLARARQLAQRQNLSESTLKRMKSFFARHSVDKKAKGFRKGEQGYPSKGLQAWLLWGGDAGQKWIKSLGV